MDEENLLYFPAGSHLGDDVRLPGASFGKAREGLSFQKAQLPEEKLGFDLGKKEPQEVPQEMTQKLLEPLILAHRLVLLGEQDDKSAPEPPGPWKLPSAAGVPGLPSMAWLTVIRNIANMRTVGATEVVF
jgi:hypothetical protein